MNLRWLRHLYAQVLVGVALGILVGALFPQAGQSLKPLGDGFIKLVKMMIAPIILCTVVHGIASMGEVKRLGRLGFKALIYFEVVSTLALLVGLFIVNTLRPGAGFNIDPGALDPTLTENYARQAKSLSTVAFLLNIIPTTFLEPLAGGDCCKCCLSPSCSRWPSPRWAKKENRCCMPSIGSPKCFLR